MTDVAKTLEELCTERGMRMTEQRRVIARILEESEDHPDVEELYRRASTLDARISIATVYRTVRLLEEKGILERRDFGGGRLCRVNDRHALAAPHRERDVLDCCETLRSRARYQLLQTIAQ